MRLIQKLTVSARVGSIMQNIPDGDNTAPEVPQLSDPTVNTATAQPSGEDGQPPVPPESAVPIVSSSGDDRLQNRSLSKKILVPALLAAIGLALLVGALMLYPSDSQLPTPQYTSLLLNSTFPISNIYYTVYQVSSSIAEIKVGIALPNGTLRPPASAPAAHLFVALPSGTDFRTCPSSSCYIAGSSIEPIEIWKESLSFKRLLGDFQDRGEAFIDLFVKAHSFGKTFNGITAAAAIPAVSCNDCRDTVMLTGYNIPAANSYDWSSYPTQFANGTSATWSEAIGAQATGRVAIGINHANQTNDNNKTFFAGALLGLAGAALLSAVQEGLHAND